MSPSPATSVRSGYPLGLTGATAATRYVGATASGAPASGTFAVGDFIIDQSGKVFVCTAAGSPGTWAEIGGSGGDTELAYAQITANVTVTSNDAANPTDVVSSGAVTYAATRVCIEFYAAVAETSAADFMTVTLWDDSTRLGNLASISVVDHPVLVRRFLTPTAASHTYRIRAYRGAVNGTIYAGDGASGNYMPAYIRVTTADSA